MADVPEIILKEYFNKFAWKMQRGTSYDNFSRLAKSHHNEFLAADMVDELYEGVYSDMDRDVFEKNIGPEWAKWEDDHPGFWKNAVRGMEYRANMFGAEIFGAMNAFARNNDEGNTAGNTFFQPVEDFFREKADESGYIDRQRWEEFKSDPGVINALKFGVEEAMKSVAEMGLSALPGPAGVAGTGAVMLSTTGRIAEERAKRNGKEVPTREDVFASLPAALAIALSERLGSQKVFGIAKKGKEIVQDAAREGGVKGAAKRIGKDVGKSVAVEGGTELFQEALETYASGVATNPA